jgi:hypothetical protein
LLLSLRFIFGVASVTANSSRHARPSEVFFRVPHCYSSQFAPLAQISSGQVLGVGVLPAKARRAPSSDNYFLCGPFDIAQDMLCVFAGDIPNLWLRLYHAVFVEVDYIAQSR